MWLDAGDRGRIRLMDFTQGRDLGTEPFEELPFDKFGTLPLGGSSPWIISA
jgi:hypothetical protein